MNMREKLLLVWALSATFLLIAGGMILFQMLTPAKDARAILEGAYDLRLNETKLYECVRVSGRCTPTTESAARFSEFYNAVRSGVLPENVVVWVTRVAPEEWRAFSTSSTHRGCFVKWENARELFVDPCGGTKWLAHGEYQEGPAPRDLDFFRVTLERELVWIDLNLVRGNNHD